MGILASCQKDPVENTACVDMAGDWYVTIDAAKNGQVVYEDVYEKGYVHMFTSNTAANIATEMILTDNFYIGKHSITFVFNPYDIACYALGKQSVTLTYNQLKTYLKS